MQDQKFQTVLYCSFCGKSQHEVKKLIAGPTVFICDECVELCQGILLEEKGEMPDPTATLDDQLKKWEALEALLNTARAVLEQERKRHTPYHELGIAFDVLVKRLKLVPPGTPPEGGQLVPLKSPAAATEPDAG